LRIFLLDSQAFRKGKQLAYSVNPDFVEVLPGISMISVDDAILKEIPSPLIAGGLIKTMEQVNEILSRGVLAVSTSEKSLWER
jgi:glycerol uptake operon antiterminator